MKGKNHIEERMKGFEKRYEEEREIKCPYCGCVQENDDCQFPVTYHGEPSITEFECQECEKTFFVKEHVSRTYDVGATEDELDI